MSQDRKTIGVTKANAAALNVLILAGEFASELDAAKFAMAFAVQRGVPPGYTEGADTKWNVGSVDADGSLPSLLEALYPTADAPYRQMEHLINEGIRLLVPTPGGAPPDVFEVLFQAGG